MPPRNKHRSSGHHRNSRCEKCGSRKCGCNVEQIVNVEVIQGTQGGPGTSCIRTDPANGCSVAEGSGTTASGFASHAEGSNTQVVGNASHSEGITTIANANAAHAEGINSTAGTSTSVGVASHAEGQGTKTEADNAHAEGLNTIASGVSSHAEGESTTASGVASHSEGYFTTASGAHSHAEGIFTTARGTSSHAEGSSTTASGPSSHAEGSGTTASGFISHAEGGGTTASGEFSHAEGEDTTASGVISHAEGLFTIASGFISHAEGEGTTASGGLSHAEGYGTIANGGLSHTEGLNTTASGLSGVHVMGQNGGPNPTVDLPFSWYLINGGVVAKILNNGSACFDSTVTASGYITATGACDYAEMFETADGQPIDVGYFVTLDGEKIRKANANDDYILGITSSNPGILADTEEPACSKYLLDEWNRPIYEEVTIPAVTDPEGNIIVAELTEMRKKINTEWDPAQPCSSRLERPEWVPVGLVGKLLVRDDGTCEINGYCKPNDEGIATVSNGGYRVMKRTGPNQILVLLK